MNGAWWVRRARALAMASLLAVALALAQRAITSAPAEPPPEVQTQSFSVAALDALAGSGVHPADIVGIGGFPAIPCANLGLVCTDTSTGADDDVIALAFGLDFAPSTLPPLEFSVDVTSTGTLGSAVRAEANCGTGQVQADVFESPLDGSNVQDLDGNGVACTTNAGFGLGLSEGAAADRVDALDRDACEFVDQNCDGVPEYPVFLTLGPGSPTLTFIGASAADILMTIGGQTPEVWASRTALGLAPGDVIDAMCIGENGNGIYDAEDKVLFSLARNSPTLASIGASPADILRPGPPSLAFGAAALGLLPGDNVAGMKCGAIAIPPPRNLYLPIIRK